MSTKPYDTLVIGAGAAGLAAARKLHDSGQRILILEARDRIGGRIWTDDKFTDFPIELGAEFIHGENAATIDLVHAAGLTTIPVDRYGKLRWAPVSLPAVPLAELPAELRATITGLFMHYRALPQHDPLPDISLAQYLRGKGWDEEALKIADVLLAQTCCATLEDLSCADLIREMRADHAGKEEFRIREGYGALLKWYSRDLPIQLNTLVRDIHWDENSVTVITANETLRARRCIITVPVSILARGTIRFIPDLPEDKHDAIHAFRTEPATKLIYRFREPFWDAETTFICHNGLATRWWTPGYGRDGAAVIGCFVTADKARILDEQDENRALTWGLTELNWLLDARDTDLRKASIGARRVSWAFDAYARGGYAHLPPGKASARPILARPEGGVLFFAGEATAHDSNPQTVHGALESGWRAAAECGA
ncbi:MAG: FAD-dependent oxidoreductase [Anaerolineae bacterium]|nr:FAD-dependent oxidoreductase [Anaerolineae bacterium]